MKIVFHDMYIDKYDVCFSLEFCAYIRLFYTFSVLQDNVAIFKQLNLLSPTGCTYLVTYGYHNLWASLWVQILHRLILNPQNFNKHFDIVYHSLHIFMYFNMHIITGCYSAIDLTETKVEPCKFSHKISYKYWLPYFTLVTLLSWRPSSLSSKHIVGCNCSYAPKVCSVLIIVWDFSTVSSIVKCESPL